MSFRFLRGAVAASLILSGTASAAASAASPLSLAQPAVVERAGAEFDAENFLRGSGWLLGAGALIAIAIGLLMLLDNDTDSAPASP